MKIAENLKYTLMIRLGSRLYPLSISRVLSLFGHVSNLYIFDLPSTGANYKHDGYSLYEVRSLLVR